MHIHVGQQNCSAVCHFRRKHYDWRAGGVEHVFAATEPEHSRNRQSALDDEWHYQDQIAYPPKGEAYKGRDRSIIRGRQAREDQQSASEGTDHFTPETRDDEPSLVARAWSQSYQRVDAKHHAVQEGAPM